MRIRPYVGIFVAATLALVLSGCSSEDGPDVPDASIEGSSTPNSLGLSPIAPRSPDDLRPDRYDDEFVPTESIEPVTVPDPYPLVVLNTSQGKITLRLDRASAPSTVENFLVYVKDGFYEKTIFHEVSDGLVVAGGYTADLKDKPTRTAIRNEAHNGKKNVRRTVAMVSLGGIHRATTQFLFNLQDNPQLDHKSREPSATGEPSQYGFCVFGEVTQGWDVVQRIAKSRTRRQGQFNALPDQTVTITSAKRIDDARVADGAGR